MNKRELISLIDQALPEGRKDFLLFLNTLAENEEIADYQFSKLARNLAYNSLWEPAEKIAGYIADPDQQTETLAYIAENLATAGRSDEAIRILLPMLADAQTQDTRLAQIDALIRIVEALMENNSPEAIDYLVMLEQELLKIDRINGEQAEMIATAAEFWIKLDRLDKARPLLETAIDIANKNLQFYEQKKSSTYEARQIY